MGTWKPTPEEEKLHSLFDKLGDFAEELGIETELIDTLFCVFYGTLEDQGKMSVMEVTDEEIERVKRETARRLGIELDDEPPKCTKEPPTEEPPTPPSIQ